MSSFYREYLATSREIKRILFKKDLEISALLMVFLFFFVLLLSIV